MTRVEPAATDQGYLTMPLLGGAARDRLRAHFDRLALPDDHGFHATSANNTREVARAVDQLLKAELGPLLEDVLPDHEPFLAAFISKGARHGVTVDYHQDWTYTDEREHRCTLFWIPLVDTNDANGALRAVPGSHRWTTGLRASGGTHATDPLQSEIDRHAVTVEVEAGSAFVYDPALVHGSPPNATDHLRPAAAIALAPRRAPLVHFNVDDAGELRGWRIDESHFTLQPFASQPVNAEPIDPWDALVTTDELAAHLVP